MARRKEEESEDELGARRRAKEENGEDPDTGDGGEMFPLGSLAGDPSVTGKNFVTGAAQVSVTAKLKNVSVPADGLVHAGTAVQLMVKAIAGGVNRVPTMEDDGLGGKRVTGWEERQMYTPAYVQDAGEVYTRPQVVELLVAAGADSATISSVLGEPEAQAQ